MQEKPIYCCMRDEGHQVLDLEGHAKHRGSLLGHTDGIQAIEQPSQKKFETDIALALRGWTWSALCGSKVSQAKSGNLHIPSALWAEIRQGRKVHIGRASRGTSPAHTEHVQILD